AGSRRRVDAACVAGRAVTGRCRGFLGALRDRALGGGVEFERRESGARAPTARERVRGRRQRLGGPPVGGTSRFSARGVHDSGGAARGNARGLREATGQTALSTTSTRGRVRRLAPPAAGWRRLVRYGGRGHPGRGTDWA